MQRLRGGNSQRGQHWGRGRAGQLWEVLQAGKGVAVTLSEEGPVEGLGQRGWLLGWE